MLVALNVRLLASQTKERALALFHSSNLYLALVVLLICAATLVP
jgi:hypothetical protein